MPAILQPNQSAWLSKYFDARGMKDARKHLEPAPSPGTNQQDGKTTPDSNDAVDLKSKIAGGKSLLDNVAQNLKAADAVRSKMSAWLRKDGRDFFENVDTALYQVEAALEELLKTLRTFDKPASANDRKGLETILQQASSVLTNRSGYMDRVKAMDKKFPYPKEYVAMLLELFGKGCDALNGVGAFIAHWQPEIKSVKVPPKMVPPGKWNIAEQPPGDTKQQDDDAPKEPVTDTAARWKTIQALQKSIQKAGNSILGDLKKLHAATKAIDHPAAKRFAGLVDTCIGHGFTSSTWFGSMTTGFDQLQSLTAKDLEDTKKFNVLILHIKGCAESMKMSASGSDVMANLDGSPFASTNILQTSNGLMDEIIKAMNKMAV